MLQEGSCDRKGGGIRSAIAHLARELSSASLQELAESLGLARRDCVPNLARRASEASTGGDLYRKLIAIENRLQPRSPSIAPPSLQASQLNEKPTSNV